MSNNLSPEMIAQLFSQSSSDPLLTLITLSHTSWAANKRFVNNTEDIISNGLTYSKFPMRITLPADDGESARQVAIEFDNVSLELTANFRMVTSPISVVLSMVLASIPNAVQMSIEELKIGQISYDRTKVSAKLYMDNFLTSALTSERYDPTTYPGIF